MDERRRDQVRADKLLHKEGLILSSMEAVSGELELVPLLDRLLFHACDLIDADDGTIGLLDRESGGMRIASEYRMPEPELGRLYPPGVGLLGEILRTGKPVILERYDALPRPAPLAGANAVLGVPISWRGALVGCFGIGRRPETSAERGRPHHFTERDADTLELFARHAAIAIENARRYGEEQERRERFQLVARIGQIVTQGLDLDDILQSAADAIHELLGYPNVAIPMLDPEDPDTLVIRIVGGHYRRLITREYRQSIHEGIMGAAVREGRTIMVDDVRNDPRHVQTPGTDATGAELSIPIRLGNVALGVLNVERPEPFGPEDAEGLEIVADQLAVAIENARLYDQGRALAALAERQRLARDLHDSVTQMLFGTVMIAESLSAAWKRDPALGEERTQRMLELSRATLGEMRSLLAELRPPEGESEGPPPGAYGVRRVRRNGLVDPLAEHARRIAGEDLDVHVDASAYLCNSAWEEALFRIGQEAVSNAVRHAAAGEVRIRIATVDDGTELEISDDGTGFDPEGCAQASESGGMGLASMRERAQAHGGRLDIESAPGRGTRLHVWVPEPEDAGCRPRNGGGA